MSKEILMSEQMKQDAKRAAGHLVALQKMYEVQMNALGLIGATIGGATLDPCIHVYQGTLDSISRRTDWTWEWVTNESGEHMYFRATVVLWGVTFMAIFDNGDAEPVEAAAYDCPEDVLNEYTPF